MLQGPISNGPLGFDTHHLRTGLTPNESGIRSGLTPGGSGSMFSVASPSANSLFQLGSSTPSTMEFQRTALSAASALRKQPTLTSIPPPLNKPEFSVTAPDARDHNPPTAKPRQLSNAFDADPAHNAANGLYMLAQAHQQNDQYSNSTVAAPANTGMISGQPNLGSTQDTTSPNSKKRALVTNTSMTRATGTGITGNTRGVSEMSEDMASDSDESDDDKRGVGEGKGGKRAAARARKNDPKSNKRTKLSQGSANGSGDDQDNDNMMNENGKKMTDEEKRKNFLERNRFVTLQNLPSPTSTNSVQ